MAKVSEIVSKICKKYMPRIREVGISFDLDFPDTTITIENHERVEKDLDRSMKSAIKRTPNGHITLSIKKGEIIISDTGTVVDKTTCKKYTTEHFIVKSRVGFGTTVTIKF
jgi:signal transduction histidine kinase